MNIDNAKSQMRKGMLEYCILRYEWQESTQGPPRKYYALTDDGHLFLNELDQAWTEIAHTVGVLKSKTDLIK